MINVKIITHKNEEFTFNTEMSSLRYLILSACSFNHKIVIDFSEEEEQEQDVCE